MPRQAECARPETATADFRSREESLKASASRPRRGLCVARPRSYTRWAAYTESPMKPPRILAVASAIDLDFRYGCTPAWWQLWKGMYEAGADVVVTPYRGRPV